MMRQQESFNPALCVCPPREGPGTTTLAIQLGEQNVSTNLAWRYSLYRCNSKKLLVRCVYVQQWVPPNYYETPLEERARELGAEPEQLCKTMIMENKSFDEVRCDN